MVNNHNAEIIIICRKLE